MALISNTQLGSGGTGFQGKDAKSAAAMIKELQGLTITVATGAAADTNVAVAGIAMDDTIVSAIEYAAGVPTARTFTITSAGNIQCAAATTGNKVVVTWFNKA